MPDYTEMDVERVAKAIAERMNYNQISWSLTATEPAWSDLARTALNLTYPTAYAAGALAMKEAAAESCREHAREQRAIPYDLADHLVNIQRNSIIVGAKI